MVVLKILRGVISPALFWRILQCLSMSHCRINFWVLYLPRLLDPPQLSMCVITQHWHFWCFSLQWQHQPGDISVLEPQPCSITCDLPTWLCALLAPAGLLPLNPKEIKLSAWFILHPLDPEAYSELGRPDLLVCWSYPDEQGCAWGSRAGSGIYNWHPGERFRLQGLSGFVSIWLKQWMYFALLLLLEKYCVPKLTSSFTERFSSTTKFWKFLLWECLVPVVPVLGMIGNWFISYQSSTNMTIIISNIT